eukprot:1156035-Pelagomonas_calceolata.AAC.8
MMHSSSRETSTSLCKYCVAILHGCLSLYQRWLHTGLRAAPEVGQSNKGRQLAMKRGRHGMVSRLYIAIQSDSHEH